MARGHGLIRPVIAYAAAAFLVAGPWILMVLALGGMSIIACDTGACAATQEFRSALIYNFAFSLVVTGPIVFGLSRYISDRLYQGHNEGVMAALGQGFGVYALLCLMATPPYLALTNGLAPEVRALGLINLVLLGASWMLLPVLGVLKRTSHAGFAFLAGAGVMLGVVSMIPAHSAASLLFAFNAGMAVIDAILLMEIVRCFGFDLRPDPKLWASLRKRPELPAIGLLYYLGLWIDKFIMWALAPIGRVQTAGTFWTAPDYDTAMFWAQLSAAPMLAVFFVQIEPGLRRRSREFFARLNRQASLADMQRASMGIMQFALSGVLALLLIQLVVCVGMMLVSLVAVDSLGFRANQMGMLRNSMIGVACHTAALFCSIFLLYFDLRRAALVIVAVFFILNTALTLLTLMLGFEYYGLGFGLASAAALIAGIVQIRREMPDLLYHAFITNNLDQRAIEEAGQDLRAPAKTA
jgi:uncharacterized membrane protein